MITLDPIRGEDFVIDFVTEASLGMYFVNLAKLHADGTVQPAEGKQWSESIQADKGGIAGYIDWWLELVNAWMLRYFGSKPPQSAFEQLEVAMRDALSIVDNQLESSL
jgi:hypothetical protein